LSRHSNEYKPWDVWIQNGIRITGEKKRTAMSSSNITVSEAIANFLEQCYSKYVFGVAGSTTVRLISAISEPHRKNLKFIYALHENASLGMADGYARASNDHAVVLLHTTPGLATCLPNLYNSFIDHVPLLVIIGDVDSRSLIKEPALALTDLADLAKPVSKMVLYAKSAAEVFLGLERSLNVLYSADPGPCCILIPEDVLKEKISGENNLPRSTFWTHVPQKRERASIPPSEKKLQEIICNLEKAKWPLLIVGREIRSIEAIFSLSNFARRLAIPVVQESPYPSAYRANFPQDHPCYLGLFRREADYIKNADFIFALGGQLVTERKNYDSNPFSVSAKIAHVTSSSRELGKNMRSDIQVLATPDDAAIILDKLSARELSENTKKRGNTNRDSRLRRMNAIREKREAEHAKLLRRRNDRDIIEPWALVESLRKTLQGKDYTIVDEGVVSSSYLSELFPFEKWDSFIGRSAGCLGWGLAAAVGVKLALPQKLVVAYVGDGAFLFGPQALWTAAHFKIPISVIVCNNCGYASVNLSFESIGRNDGMERYSRSSKVNELGYEIQNPELDIVKISEGLGVKGFSVRKSSELEKALAALMGSNHQEETRLIDVRINPSEKGYEGSVGTNSAWT
jgi:benzoylformate decarboxylase